MTIDISKECRHGDIPKANAPGMSYGEVVRAYTDICKTIKTSYKALEEAFVFQTFTPLLYIGAGETIDLFKVKACQEIINRYVDGNLSRFRVTGNLPYAVILSKTSNPEEMFLKTYEIFNEMIEYGFNDSCPLTFAALEIAVSDRAPEDYLEIFDRMAVYSNDVGGDPRGSACSIMFGLGNRDLCRSVARVNEFYDGLGQHFKNKYAARVLAEMLMLSDANDDAVTDVAALAKALNKHRYKFDQKNILPSLWLLYALSEGDLSIVEKYKKLYGILDAETLTKYMWRDKETQMIVSTFLLAYTEGVDPKIAALLRTQIIMNFSLMFDKQG